MVSSAVKRKPRKGKEERKGREGSGVVRRERRGRERKQSPSERSRKVPTQEQCSREEWHRRLQGEALQWDSGIEGEPLTCLFVCKIVFREVRWLFCGVWEEIVIGA